MRGAAALALCLVAGAAAADDVSALFGSRVGADARFKLATADFDGDGKADRLALVSVAAGPLAKEVTVADRLFGSDASTNRSTKTALAFAMGNGREFLVTDKDFFATPIWSETPVPLSVAKRGSAPFKAFAAQDKHIVHDIVVLGTEAGIDIALYWNGKGFAVFWPAEEP